ncbi:MAG: hypothetical protein ACE364_08245 [Chlorobiota bacterium]
MNRKIILVILLILLFSSCTSDLEIGEVRFNDYSGSIKSNKEITIYIIGLDNISEDNNVYLFNEIDSTKTNIELVKEKEYDRATLKFKPISLINKQICISINGETIFRIDEDLGQKFAQVLFKKENNKVNIDVTVRNSNFNLYMYMDNYKRLKEI